MHYNHQLSNASQKKQGQLPPYLLLNIHAYRKSIILVIRWYLQKFYQGTQMHFFSVTSQHMTFQVMWQVPAWELTFQLPQHTVIIRIEGQGVQTKSSSFQISHSQAHSFLQLDHPVTCENIKCYFCQLTSENNHIHTDNLTH